MLPADPATLLAGYAVVAFALFAVLGAAVARRTPGRLDVEAVALRGVGVSVAVRFTTLGYWPALTVLAMAAVAVARPAGIALWLALAIVGSHALSQTALAALKLVFRRTRPDYWLVRHESDTSYPSGHSATALTFYVAFAILAAHARAPDAARIAATALLALCAVGVPWSRLALGAHYLTDVLGGLLFGSAWLAASAALVVRVAAT